MFNKGYKKAAFTLAEVLITLGIIAILAAVTIPSLMKNVNASKYSSQFQQALSSLNQAIKMAQSNFDVDYASTNEKCNIESARSESATQVFTFCSIYNSTLSGASYVGQLSAVPGYSIRVRSDLNSYFIFDNPVYAEGNSRVFMSTMPSDYLGYSLASGVMVGFNKDAVGCAVDIGNLPDLDWISNHTQCIGFIDINGVAGPNTVVNCDDVNALEINPNSTCAVTVDANHITDIYPVIFYNGSVIPATPAARSIASKWRQSTLTDNLGGN